MSSSENYGSSGHDARECYALTRKYLTPENLPKVANVERRIAAWLNTKYTSVVAQGYQDSGELRAECDALIDLLEGARNKRRARPFAPNFSILVLAGEESQKLELSLRSLTAQTQNDWEALVMVAPGTPYDAEKICAAADPRGRIRAVLLTEAGTESLALNIANVLASGNAYLFLRAGNAFAPTHIQTLDRAMRQADAEVVISAAVNVSIDQSTGEERRIAYPQMSDYDGILIAPIVPLEAIAIRQDQLESMHHFVTDEMLFPEWQLGARLRVLGVPINIVEADPVEVHVTHVSSDPFILNKHLLFMVMRWYDIMSLEKDGFKEARAEFLKELGMICDRRAGEPLTVATLLTLFKQARSGSLTTA